MSEDLEILVRVLFSNVEWRKVERGIAVRPVNQPRAERIVEMSADVRDRVWDWLHNPRIVNREEWTKIREPVKAVLAEVTDIILRHGSPLQQEVFKKGIEKLLNSISRGTCKTQESDDGKV
ncbi:MAG: hypothetical protein QXW82_06530 [Candidatus Bathyarchaeia archaeon]